MNETISRAFAGVMPSIAIDPALSGLRPATSFSKVDFPHPDGPMMLTNSRLLMTRFTLSKMAAPGPYRFVAA